MSDTATEGTTTDHAREKAQEVGAQTKEKAQEAGAQARGRVRDEVDRRSTQAGEQAGSTAQALRDASGRLRDEGNEPVARGLEQVADRVDRAGGWLRDSDGDTILRNVEDFGRRNTLAVIAGGVAVGFVASRLLKASSRRRYEAGGSQLPVPAGDGSGNGATTARLAPDTTVSDPALTPSAPVPPRDAGLTGGTPAPSPLAFEGEDEGRRAP